MKKRKSEKQGNLEAAGVLNFDPDRVQDPLFQNSPEFFDAQDNLQVRYEMLRAHLVDGDNISAICRRFDVSRQTFYNVQDRFLREGTAGLLPKPSGPKGASKLTTNVVTFIEELLKKDEAISCAKMLPKVEKQFGVSLHRRTVEKLLKTLRSKKNS